MIPDCKNTCVNNTEWLRANSELKSLPLCKDCCEHYDMMKLKVPMPNFINRLRDGNN